MRFGKKHARRVYRFAESTPPADPEKKGETPPEKKTETPTVAKQIDEHTVEVGGQRFVLQTKVNELIGGARTEGRTAGEQAAKDAAERAANEQQGEFKKLYDEAKPKLEETEGKLSSAEEELKTLNAEIEKDVAELLKALPDKAQKLLPDNLTPVKKREWLRTAIDALGDADQKRKPGNGANPPAGGAQSDEERFDSIRARLKKTGIYGRL